MPLTRDTALKELTKNAEMCAVKSKAHVPAVTLEDVIKNRKLCEKNLCGNYNKSWTCPPNCDSEERCVKKMSEYRDADVLSIRYENLDFKDREDIEKKMSDFQDFCRRIMIDCRKNGIETLALADGKCNFCKKCALLDGKPCKSPEMQIAPISAHGIDMERYLNSEGESFRFEKDAMTLYAIFLFK